MIFFSFPFFPLWIPKINVEFTCQDFFELILMFLKSVLILIQMLNIFVFLFLSWSFSIYFKVLKEKITKLYNLLFSCWQQIYFLKMHLCEKNSGASFCCQEMMELSSVWRCSLSDNKIIFFLLLFSPFSIFKSSRPFNLLISTLVKRL